MTTDQRRWAVPVARQSAARPGETADSSLSVEMQLAVARRYAGERPEVYAGVLPPIIDYDVSGADWARDGLAAMHEQARGDLDFVVYRFDRLARDLLLQETIIRGVEAKGARVVSATEDNSPLLRGIVGAINEDFRRQHGARISAVKRQRAQRGRANGAVPFGYRRSGVREITLSDGTVHVHPSGDLEPDPATAPVVAELFERVDRGESRFSVLQDLWARGALPMAYQARNTRWALRLLRLPLYAGMVAYKGEIVRDASGEPVRNEAYRVVDDALWWRVQDRLGREATVRGGKAGSSWLEGLVVHGCGARMYLAREERAGRATRERFVCRWRTTQGYVHAERCGVRPVTVAARGLEAAVRRCLVADLGRLATVGEAVAAAERAAGGTAARDRRAALLAGLAKAEGRAERARALWIEEGTDHARAVYDRLSRLAKAERERVDGELSTLPAVPDAGRYAAMGARLAELAAWVGALDGPDLRQVLGEVGVAEYAGGAVRVAYRGESAFLVPSPVREVVGRGG